MRESLSSYCVRAEKSYLLDEWDKERNAPLMPDSISYSSHEKVWWHCTKGHSWQTALYTRTGSGAGCPYCKGRRALPGENDLASQRPDLAAQWHPTKNDGFTPADVLLGSHHKAWWVCEKSHEWQAMVKTRALGGNGCPVCANRVIISGENDLASLFPDVAKQWHPNRNGELTPEQVGAGAHRKVWWRCERGHEWEAAISSRTSSGGGCPYCAGRRVIPGETDLATLFPETAAQWHTGRNGALTPQAVSAYSNKKVWWKCPKGHEYQAVVAGRTKAGGGCPYCAGKRVLAGFNDLSTTYPEIAAQWHPTRNEKKPSEVTAGSKAKVWWLCSQGHAWQAVISSRTCQNLGCPVCANKIILPEENSLAALMPLIAAEWHPTRNGALRPETVAVGNGRRVWWRCSLGHEWMAKICDRTRKNSGCPVCMNKRVLAGFNDLATTHPKIAAQWHPTMNGKLTPQMFTYGSTQRAWWLCPEGHAWKAPIARRAGTEKSGCPVCAGRVSMAKRRYYAAILEEAQEKQIPVSVLSDSFLPHVTRIPEANGEKPF